MLLRHLVQDTGQQTGNAIRLARLLEANDCAGLRELFQAFFASIPYEWYAARQGRRPNNDIANYEGFYASVFYSYFAALGYEITVEESTVEESSSHGRLDMAVRTGGHVYLFEFKVVEMAPPGSALAQLRERDYAARYRGRGEPIHLIGVESRSPTADAVGRRRFLYVAPSSAASSCRLNFRKAASSMPVAASMLDHGKSRSRNPSIVRICPSSLPS